MKIKTMRKKKEDPMDEDGKKGEELALDNAPSNHSNQLPISGQHNGGAVQ